MASQAAAAAPASSSNNGHGDDPKVLYAIQWLYHFGAQVPAPFLHTGHGFYDSLMLHGLKIVHVHHGQLICSLRVPLSLCNAAKSLHGGAVASLVDIVGSAAIVTTGAKYTGVSVEINVSYMSTTRVDEEIEIEARVLRAGKNLAFVSVDLRKKETGELIAQGRHTKYTAPPKTPRTSKL